MQCNYSAAPSLNITHRQRAATQLLPLTLDFPFQTLVSVDFGTFGKEAVAFHQHCDWVVKENMFCNSENIKL